MKKLLLLSFLIITCSTWAQSATGYFDKAMKKAEDQGGNLGVGLHAEPAPEGAKIVERLVDHREADDRVDDVAVDARVEIDAEQHRGGVAQREQADIGRDILHPVQEEDHAQQEQDVVVARHHVLRAQVDEGHDVHASDLEDVALVAFGDGMGEGRCGPCQQQDGDGGYARSVDSIPAQGDHPACWSILPGGIA